VTGEGPFDRWAHRRDPDLDAPPPPKPPPARLGGPSRYGWITAVVVVLALAYIAVNTLRTPGLGGGLERGARLPPFAVPKLASSLDGDANVATKPGEGAGRSGRVPACAVRDPRALNVCRLAARAPLVLSFAATKDEDTLRQLDALQAASRRVPRVRFAGVFLRGSRADARRTARERGWTFPLGWDRHGDVAAVYGVKALPVTVLADSGRRASATLYRRLGARELVRRARGLR
jgi:hypothetical protein